MSAATGARTSASTATGRSPRPVGERNPLSYRRWSRDLVSRARRGILWSTVSADSTSTSPRRTDADRRHRPRSARSQHRAGARPTRRSGHRVRTDRTRAGTTATSYGWINSHRKHPRSYHDLNVAGIAEHVALWEHGCDWYIRSGLLEWACADDDRERLATNLVQLREYGHPLERITRTRATELAPTC